VRKIIRFTLGSICLAVWLPTAPAQDCTIIVQAGQPGVRVSSNLFGIFFEDINCSADGGIYAELVRNRSLEDSDKPDHWTMVTTGSGKGILSVSLEQPMGDDLLSDRNRRSLKLEVTEAGGDSTVGAANDGYWGIAVQEGAKYDLTLFARASEGFAGQLIVTLQSTNGKVYATGSIGGLRDQWKSYKLQLTSSGTDPKACLVLSAAQKGTVWLDMVSLFPVKTWKGRGLRTDLMDKLAGLKPAFMRFPGGCWVEGDTMKFAYRWKDTVGDVSQRRTHYNIWEYYATHGVGFHEYLQMCEDLGAEPLFVINCGMSHKETIPMDQMGPFVQDALDAIEYCNGPVTSRYGGMRAKNGHPAPFNLKFMEIGNENGGAAYAERWPLFHKAIKAKHPEMVLIANHWAGGYPTNIMPEVVDEHYYSSPEFFIQHADQYDKYDRKGPKIYVGEYAVTQGCGQGNLRAAVGEAAFMTGMERNADVVVMASYAPLFANVNYKKWNPDLICYDSDRSYVLPSYYVQQLFAQHRGNVVLPVQAVSPLTQGSTLGGTVGVGSWMTAAEFKDMKVTVDGQTVYEWSPVNGTNEVKTYNGSWSVVDGALRQTSLDQNVRALVENRFFTNYTYTLKARKLSGDEGFVIPFNVTDTGAKSWWNIGGWRNDHHALEIGGIIGNETKGRIETNRWYDLRIEVTGMSVKCYLDGELTSEGKVPDLTSLHASATRDDASGDIILKVVNVAPGPLETEVRFDGVSKLAGPASAIVLTSEKGEDENSLDQPAKVSPKTTILPVNGTILRHSFPGNSFTVLRVKAG
jgi:alpha-L-arabinofuranosidase